MVFPYSIHLKGFIYEKTSMGLVKIRKKYRFDFCVPNIKKDISYTKIPLINAGFDDFLIISKIFHRNNGD